MVNENCCMERRNDYDRSGSRQSFCKDFEGLVCQVTNWDGLFAGMAETSRKYAWTQRHPDGSIARFVSGLEPDAQNAAWLLMDEQGSVQASFR